MTHSRRSALAWLAAPLMPALTSLAGCASGPKPVTRHYTEKVESLLMSQDRLQLVFLGEKHHYVFDTPADVALLMTASARSKATATFSPFRVNLDGTTTGTYHLLLPADLSEAEVIEARQMGMSRQPDGHWERESSITGKRFFQSSTLRSARVTEKLQHPYVVTVEAVENLGEQPAQSLSSPVYMASHGVMLLYFAPLAPVLLPVMFLAYDRKPGEPVPEAQAGAASAPTSKER